MTTSGLPPVIVQTLAAVAGRERRVQVLRGVGESVAVFVVGLGTVAVIDALAKPGHGWHLVLSLSAYGAAGTVFIVRALVPMLRRPRLVETAHAIEGRCDDRLDERLSSAVELAGRPAGGVSEWMIERTIALAAQTAAALDPQRLVAMTPARLAWIRGGALAAALIGACVVPGFSPYVLRAALPTLPRPSHVQLEVLPGDRTIALGSALDVLVRAQPDPGTAALQVTWDDGVVELMACEPGAKVTAGSGNYTLNLPAVTRAFSYRVVAGDGESRAYRIAVARPPELSKVALRITPPAYTGLPARTIDGGDAEIIAGSTVALTAELTGEAASSASVVFEGGETAAALKDGIVTAELKPTANLAYGLRLVGAGGLVAEPAQRWILAVMPDRAPSAKLSGDGLDAGLIGADEALVLAAEVGDDLGLRGVDLVVEVDGKERQRRALPLMGSRKEAKLPVALDLGGIGLELGQQLSVSVRATDLGGQTTSSQPLALAVASAADARAAALALRLRAVLKQIDGALEASRVITRTWNGLARGAGADRATRDGDLTLMANRIALWNGDLAQAGSLLAREGTGPDVGNGRQLLNLGDELAAWTRGAAGLLGETCQAGRAERVSADDLLRGRDLAEALQGDLQAFRHDVALLAARLEVGGLAGGAEAAIARLRRALPIARGERGWRGDSDRAKPGLLGTWFVGSDFSGQERHREVGVPVWRNREVPGLGRDNWCVRYVGEIRIPKDGEWMFSAGADDGVRLAVAGNNIFHNEGWKTQGYTEYRGKLTLKAGWHPVILEMFQGGGESGLGFSFGANEGALRAVGPDDLRCRADGDAQGLVRAMTSLPREQVAAADERLKQAMTQAAAIPAQLQAAGDTAGNDELVRMGRDRTEAAKRLTDELPKLTGWPIAKLDSAARDVEHLAGVARHAREVLNNQVGHELRERVAPGDLAGLRQAITRVREQAKDLRQIPERIQPQDRAARLRLGGTAGRAWIGFTVGEAERQRRARLDAARTDGTALNARNVHLQAARKLAELGERAFEAVAAVASLPSQPDQAAQKLEEQANRLEQALREVQQWEEREQRQQAAVAAAGLADQARELNDAKRWAGATAEAKWGELADEVRDVARALRRGGDFDRARDLEQMLGSGILSMRGGELIERLAHVARGDDQWHGGLDRLTAEQLKRRGDELGKRPGDARTLDGTVIDLDEARLALAVEGEQRRTKDKDDVGLAFALLAKDIGVVADSGVAATKQQVDDFAERAAVLAGMRGDRNKEIAAAKERAASEPRSEEAQKLDKLADQADKAKDKAEVRKELTEALAKLAKEEPVDARAEREERAELAAELKDLARRDAELAAQEQAARKAFAEAERQIASALAKVAEEAKQAVATTPDQPLAEALKAAERAAPEAARDAAKLADNASRQAPASAQPKADAAAQQADAAKPDGAKPDAGQQAQDAGAKQPDGAQAAAKPDAAKPADAAKPGDSAKPADAARPEGAQAQAQADANAQTPSAQLVQDANALADRLEQQVAKPLAERFQQAGAEGKDPQARQRAAEVGRALADAVAAEREAAEKLAEVIADRAENRSELAAALDRADGDESAASSAQQKANELQQQADSAQAAADRAEAQAEQAEARADQAAGTPQAQEAANQAKAADANAAQAEANAVAAQQRALDAQLAAVQEAQKQGGDAAAEQLAQAAENLAQAQQNSLAAVEQSSQSENPAASPQTASQAGENLKRASAALEAIAAALPQAATAAAAELAQVAGEPAAGEQPAGGEPAAGAPGEQAQAGQGEPAQGQGKGQGQGQGQGQGEGQDGNPTAEAAAEALAAIEASPNNPGEAFRNAAAVLANAAAQARLGQSVGQQSQGQGQGKGQGQGQGKGQGKGQAQAPGKGGGENQGQAKSTGEAGSATGMRRAPPGVDQADWARSRAENRANIKSAGVEQFGEEHQEAIRAYLKRLGEEK